jgi:transposase
MTFISLDAHKRYSLACVQSNRGRILKEKRIEHARGVIREFFSSFKDGTNVALETVGNWYWIVDEIEEAGLVPTLVHAGKAKLLMGMANKTDRLDARGLNKLQMTGVLPMVWIPPGDLRDKRDLSRTRMGFVKQRTQLKNRIHSTLSKYALSIDEVSDIFSKKGRKILEKKLEELPPETAFAARLCLEELDGVQARILALEKRMKETFESTGDMDLLKTIPGVGPILSMVILSEVGDVNRFATGAKLAAYSGTTPKVHSSGGKTRYGNMRKDVNRTLKWAFIEAANSVCLYHKKRPARHVSKLYSRIRGRRNHQKAIGAVARHLAEAVYWVLKKQEPYREPRQNGRVSSTEGQTR